MTSVLPPIAACLMLLDLAAMGAPAWAAATNGPHAAPGPPGPLTVLQRTGDGPYEVAAGDCSDAGSKAASQTGGQVLSVSSRQQGGQTVCIVTVLVPGKDGGRPRKQTVTIKP